MCPFGFYCSFLLYLFLTLMDNEFMYLCSTTNTLSMGALNCIAHLLPLLRPLRFIINACNKCVTSNLVVIIGNDVPSLFSDSLAAPLFISLSMGRGKNITVRHFMFRVWHNFPPFLFFSLSFHSFLFVAFHLLRAFPPHLSFSPLVLLVSSLCFLSCIVVFMVDYSLVSSDCPSVSFFFTRLCGLLKIVGRKQPKVRLFVGRNYPFRFVLCFLFPLVHHSRDCSNIGHVWRG